MGVGKNNKIDRPTTDVNKSEIQSIPKYLGFTVEFYKCNRLIHRQTIVLKISCGYIV